MENYDEYKVLCIRLKEGTQIYLLSKETHLSFLTEKAHLVLFPMIGNINETGSLDFDQYVEYSDKEVLLVLDDIRSVSKPATPIELLYRQAVKRIEFLNSQPEKSKAVLKEAMKELRMQAENGKTITVKEYREEIIKQTDRMICQAEGIVEDSAESQLPNQDIEVNDTKNGKPVLH